MNVGTTFATLLAWVVLVLPSLGFMAIAMRGNWPFRVGWVVHIAFAVLAVRFSRAAGQANADGQTRVARSLRNRSLLVSLLWGFAGLPLLVWLLAVVSH